jgi:cell division septation protein DedD
MDKALKQRLVGASVLIGLSVIILPMLLSGRPDSEQQESEPIELPARPDGMSFETRRFPLVEDTATPQKRAGAEAQTAQSGSEGVKPEQSEPDTASSVEDSAASEVEVEGQQVESQTGDQDMEGLPPVTSVEVTPGEKVDLPVSVNAAAEAASPQTSSGRYAVQVASLGSDANAKRLQSDLEAKGFKVIVDKIESDVGRLNRVRVGPFDSESAAAEAVKKIQSQLDDISPRMVDLDPAANSQVTNPSDPLVRWIVQLGSFGETSNAENLVKQVRAQGLSAYSEKVTSSSGAAINRVRVGPFLQREDAAKAQQDLKSSLTINGVVMSAD